MGIETAKKFSKDDLENALSKLSGEEFGMVLRAKGIVQGNDGTRDWYFSKKLNLSFGGETVFKDQIMAATGAFDVSLADCKIWIEGTNSFEGITYAVPATEASIPVVTINSVKLTGMEPTLPNFSTRSPQRFQDTSRCRSSMLSVRSFPSALQNDCRR